MTGPTGTFTEREMNLIAGAIQCTKETFTIDNTKFAAKCGFKNAESARVAWYGLKKKIDKMAADGSDEPAESTTTASTPKSTPKSVKKRKAAYQDGNDEESEATPTKPKAKRRGTPKKQAQGESANETNAEDEIKVENKIEEEAAEEV